MSSDLNDLKRARVAGPMPGAVLVAAAGPLLRVRPLALVRPLLAAASLIALAGCAAPAPWVKPYEREHFADPIMSLNRDPISSSYRDHVLESREGARGATGAVGGGCGCN